MYMCVRAQCCKLACKEIESIAIVCRVIQRVRAGAKHVGEQTVMHTGTYVLPVRKAEASS